MAIDRLVRSVCVPLSVLAILSGATTAALAANSSASTDTQAQLVPAAAGASAGPAGGSDTASAAGAPILARLKEVVVTGSRLSASFTTPTPVMSISSAQLSALSPDDLATALAQTPALADSELSSNAGTASANHGTNGQDLLNLRALGVNRTLVLMDGERLGTTNVQDSVDINIIPQNLVKRVDIVTGGASATYGSDAVAGVVNFVLDTDFQGLKADLNAGTTTYGDATNGSASIAFGKHFGDHFRLIASGSVYETGGIGLPPTGRSWDDDAYGAYPNIGPGPTTLVVPDARSSNATYGGLITGVNGCATASCQALVGEQFGAGGALEPFQKGAQAGTSFASGGDGGYVVNGISPTEDRENGFVHAEWDVNPGLTLFSDGLFSRTYTSLLSQPYYANGQYQFTIFKNNAYLPAAVQSIFAANPSMTSFTMGEFLQEGGSGIVTLDTRDEVGLFSVGAKGAINDTWTYSTALLQQYTADDIDVKEPITQNLYASADAVADPATGQIACETALTGVTPGCVPGNYFGPNSASAAAMSYITGDNRGDTVFRHTAFDANLSGDLGQKAQLGAGPINVALGLDFRHDIADRHVDPLSDIDDTECADIPGCPKYYDNRYGGYTYYNPSPLYGWTSATEGYAELGIPLLRDLPLVKLLSADLAGRETDYNLSGVQDSWKLGLQWKINSSVMLRGTDSQDIRAPDVIELFNTASTTVAQDLFPYSTAPTQYRVTGINTTVGNQDLQPEIGHTITAGIVLSPAWMSGWEGSLDYYHIQIAHAIENTSTQGIINGCYQGLQADCRLVTINGSAITGTNGITAATTGVVVTAPTENVGNEGTSGLDLDSAYMRRVGPGDLSANVVANYLLTAREPTSESGCPVVDLVGLIGGCLGGSFTPGFPRWTGSVSLQYSTRRYSAYLRERFISSGDAAPYDIVGLNINRNMHVPMIAYTDLSLSYTAGFGGRGQVYLNVTNLFNRNPPLTSISSSSWVDPTDYYIYDVLGRRFLLGYRLNL